jgi:hypothetical protein
MEELQATVLSMVTIKPRLAFCALPATHPVAISGVAKVRVSRK